MHCPACNAVNPAGAARCASCNAALKRATVRRRTARDTEIPDPRTVAANRGALRAYHLSLIGLIPPAGLVLGPIALVLGILAARKARDDPSFTAHGPVRAAVVFGLADAVTNWVGVTLMAIGLLLVFRP
jgi:hypothetical protein